jgi:transposase
VQVKVLITRGLASIGRPSKRPVPKERSVASGRVIQDRTVSRVIRIQFGKQDCLVCPCRSQCTTASTNPRQLVVRPQAQFEAIQAARQRQQTQEFKERYAIRAGIEGTISQGVRAFDLRRSRYIGLAKTHLQHVITATAINVSRLLAWMRGIPLEGTRVSRFAALAF